MAKRVGLAVAVTVLLAVGFSRPGWTEGAGAAAAAASILSVTGTIADSLRRAQEAGKPVELQLRNGHSYAGKIGEVGDHTVLVKELRGKEFFDALVRLDDIVAVEVRVRDR
jgi:hypothetical protein